MYLTKEQAQDKHLITELASQMVGPVSDVQELRGLISFNYLINGKYIFKLPSHRTETNSWERQSHNLPHLQEQLKYQIPIPKVACLNLPQGQIIGYCYPRIEGNVLKRSTFRKLPLSQKIAFFEKLSDAINQLHSINPNILPEHLPTYADAFISLLSENQSTIHLHLKNIEDTFRKKGIYLNKKTPCHLDLHSENIVLDDKNNIVGILDWDNLCLGEPFMEFYTRLYGPSDLRILRNIHQKQTQKKINPEAFQCMDDLYNQMMGLFALGILTRRPNKWSAKMQNICPQNWKRAFRPDTDRWADFGH